jgi:hypothetical protein
VATTFLTEYVFEMKHWGAWAVNAGYPLVGMLLMGAILGAWQTKEEPAKSQTAAA